MRTQLKGLWEKAHGTNAQTVLGKFNPVIRGWANYFRTAPDDPRLRSYWMERQAEKAKDLTLSKQKLAKRQHGRCPQCGESLFNDEELQVHHLHARAQGGKNVYSNLVLVHLFCHQHVHAASKRALSDCQQFNNRDLLAIERKAARRSKHKEQEEQCCT